MPTNIQTMGIPEEKEKEEQRKYFKKYWPKTSELDNYVNLHIQEAQETMRRINTKRSALR